MNEKYTMLLKGKTVFQKLWYFLRTYILTIPRFDLFLQGSLLITILLEANVYLLLTRDASEGHSPALIQDWVMVGASGAEFLLGALVAWWGGARRHLALSGWLGLTAAAGLVVLLFPFAVSNPTNVELCGGQTISYSSYIGDENFVPRTVFLVSTAVLCCLTKVSIWAHGLTYLDDHEPQNGAYFYGILISIRLSLGLSGQNWLQPSSLREDWWMGHLSISMLTLMFAVLFTFFPKRMPQWEESDEPLVDMGFFASLGRVARNKVVVIQTFALAFLSTAVFGFVHYDRAYVQARFQVEAIRQDPRTSRGVSDIFRALVVIFFVMIFRMRFSVRRSDGVKGNTASRVGGVVAAFVAIFLTALSALSCPVGDIAGMEGSYQQPACSASCGCTSERYGFSPVCGLDSQTTYFSPCNAGCSDYEDLNGFPVFHNCSCTERAVRGACALGSCITAYSAYLILYTVVLAVSGASFLMQGMVLLRAVRRGDKAITIGASFATVALLSSVLGHLLYMLISHVTCAYDVEGACLFHGPSVWTLGATSAAMALVSAALSLLASRVHHPQPEPTTEL